MVRTRLLNSSNEFINASGIYQIKSIFNDKRYIGGSTKLMNRNGQHLYNLRLGIHPNKYLQNHYDTIDKIKGKDLIFGIIEFCSKERIKEREQYWMDKIQPEFNSHKSTQGRNTRRLKRNYGTNKDK